MEASNYVKSQCYVFLLVDMKLESSSFLDAFDSILKGSMDLSTREEVNNIERSVIIVDLLWVYIISNLAILILEMDASK
jgi:hypothetical protein